MDKEGSDISGNPTEQSENNEESYQGSGNNLNSSISQAKSAADNFLSAVGKIETELEGQVTDLEGQVMILEAKNYGLQVAAEHLQKQLKEAKQNCQDPDSPEAMAGDVLAPPTNSDGTLTGDF